MDRYYVVCREVCREGRRLSATRASLGLAGAALAYVWFALQATRDALSPEVAVEMSGLALYGTVAFVGAARKSYVLVAIGWVLHVLWDELLHPALQPQE